MRRFSIHKPNCRISNMDARRLLYIPVIISVVTVIIAAVAVGVVAMQKAKGVTRPVDQIPTVVAGQAFTDFVKSFVEAKLL